MERYTLAQRIEIVKIHYINGEKIANTLRKVRTAFGRNEAPSRTAIVKLINKFERHGQVSDIKNPTRARTARSIENIAAVAESVVENPNLSLSKRSQELGISQASLHRILHKDLSQSKEENNSAEKELFQICVVCKSQMLDPKTLLHYEKEHSNDDVIHDDDVQLMED